MVFHSYFARTLLLVVLMVLGAASGCKQQSGQDQSGQSSVKTKQVTVEVTGMT